jgi:hypothetical protein
MQHRPSPSTVVNERDAAPYIGMSVPFLRAARLGRTEGPAFIRIGRAIRYRVQDLDAFIAARRIERRPGRRA